MRQPLVTFIVPCYRLAHYLGACLDSLLSQTHHNLEVLVMDDCSPDHTPAVVAEYRDERVRHVRNEPNLGHLRNYNKGIGLATGEYIWLISADDCLRSPHAVERYLAAMESDLGAAYAFCPAIAIDADGRETGLVEWTRPFTRTATFDGRRFLETLAQGNCVSAASVMVRRRCYEVAGAFPTDLPHAGDWYLWCLFALQGAVLYFDEPFVSYRMHGANLSTTLIGTKRELVREDQAKVRWRVRELARSFRLERVVRICTERLVNQYAIDVAETVSRHTAKTMAGLLDGALAQHAPEEERDAIHALMCVALADQLFGREKLPEAAYFYRAALHHNPALLMSAIKLAVAKAGLSVAAVRRAAHAFRALFGRS